MDILIIGGGYAPFSLSVAGVARLAHQYEVPVYPCINQKPGGCTVLTDEATLGNRGLASNWYRQGADGIYFWNLGVPLTWPTRIGQDLANAREKCYASLTDVGNPKTLARKDKLFGVDGPVFRFYAHISGRPPLPKNLKPDKVHRVPLVVGDDVATAAKAGTLAQLKLSIKLKGPAQKEALVFRLNGQTLTDGELVLCDAEKSAYQVNYLVGVPPVHTGQNIIELSLGSAPASPVQCYDIKLKVKYSTKAPKRGSSPPITSVGGWPGAARVSSRSSRPAVGWPAGNR